MTLQAPSLATRVRSRRDQVQPPSVEVRQAMVAVPWSAPLVPE